MAQPLRTRATIEDLYAIPDAERHHELLDGEIVERAEPTAEHGIAQHRTSVSLDPFDRPPGRGGAGGWWFASDVDTLLATGDLVRSDLVGWRRDRHPERPAGRPVTARPDWILEIVSTHPERDRVRKLRIYQRAEVGHYWVLDPSDGSLLVFRWSEAGYLLALTALRGEKVHAEPFEAIEIVIARLLGDDE